MGTVVSSTSLEFSKNEIKELLTFKLFPSSFWVSREDLTLSLKKYLESTKNNVQFGISEIWEL